MPRALVTGVGGFVASHLTEYLLANTNWEIHGLLRWQDSLDNLADVRLDSIQLHYADVRDAGSVRNVVRNVKPYYVFHLAAQSYPQTSFSAPADTLETNAQGTLHVLEAVREFAPEAWIQVCSSSEVYGKVSRENTPITEDCPFHPASPYAISKVSADLLGQFYAEAYGLRTVITRMFTHTGPRRGDVFAESSFAKQIAMIECGYMEPPIMVGNLESVRTVADVRDAVRAYHMALTWDLPLGAVYNIGGTHTCTVGDMLETLMRLSGNGYKTEVSQDRMRPIDADNQIPDCSRFTAHTGWKPEIPFEKTMTDLLSFWRERVSGGAVVVQR